MSYAQIRTFLKSLTDLQFLSSLSDVNFYEKQIKMKPFFWRATVSAFAPGCRSSRTALKERLSQEFIARLHSVSQRSFVDFFTKRIHVPVNRFLSKIFTMFPQQRKYFVDSENKNFNYDIDNYDDNDSYFGELYSGDELEVDDYVYEEESIHNNYDDECQEFAPTNTIPQLTGADIEREYNLSLNSVPNNTVERSTRSRRVKYINSVVKTSPIEQPETVIPEEEMTRPQEVSSFPVANLDITDSNNLNILATLAIEKYERDTGLKAIEWTAQDEIEFGLPGPSNLPAYRSLSRDGTPLEEEYYRKIFTDGDTQIYLPSYSLNKEGIFEIESIHPLSGDVIFVHASEKMYCDAPFVIGTSDIGQSDQQRCLNTIVPHMTPNDFDFDSYFITWNDYNN